MEYCLYRFEVESGAGQMWDVGNASYAQFVLQQLCKPMQES